MTQSQYIINRKVNIVELAEKLGNISEACRNLGVSRQHFYDVKAAIEEDGLEGLLEKLRRSPRIAIRLSPEIEKMVLDYSLEYPTRGQHRVANDLKSKGTMISDGGVRGNWSRHTLLRKPDRFKRLEKFASERGVILTESQIVAIGSAKEEKQAHGDIETFRAGFFSGRTLITLVISKGWVRYISKPVSTPFRRYFLGRWRRPRRGSSESLAQVWQPESARPRLFQKSKFTKSESRGGNRRTDAQSREPSRPRGSRTCNQILPHIRYITNRGGPQLSPQSRLTFSLV